MVQISDSLSLPSSTTSIRRQADPKDMAHNFADTLEATIQSRKQEGTTSEAMGEAMHHQMEIRGATSEQISMVNDIFTRAEDSNISPFEAKNFLRTLSCEQLKALQLAHTLADPINIDALSNEGAVNLILSDDNQLDVNNDGMLQIGKGSFFRMPPPNAPEGVKKAWDELSKGMNSKDSMFMGTNFMAEFLTANLKMDATGQVTGSYAPGDPEWTNPFDADSFTWQDNAQKLLNNLEAAKNNIPREQYEHQKQLLTQWKALLANYGVA